MMYISFGAVFALFSLTWVDLAQGLALEQRQQQQQQHALQLAPGHQTSGADEFADRGRFTRDSLFRFATDSRQPYYLTVQDVIDSSKFRGGAKGIVHVASGDTRQEYNFEVLVRLSSLTSKDVLDSILVDVDDHELTVRSLTPPLRPGEPRPDLNVTIVIFVKPHNPTIGIVNIWTKFLDILLHDGLSLETKRMQLRSVYGSITSTELFAFTAHHISIETVYGAISGSWSLPSSVSFRSVHGAISIDLVPKRWSYGPTTQGDLSVTTTTGDIDIRMPFETSKLSLRNGNTTILSASGSIRGNLVHGRMTTLKTNLGSINVTMLPYWAFSQYSGIQFNHITTDCEYGETYVEILPPIVDSYYKIPPLCFAKSSHEHGYGIMELRYPREWCGKAMGEVQNGVVKIRGEDFEVIEESTTRVKVQRKPLGSDLVFKVKHGSAELFLK